MKNIFITIRDNHKQLFRIFLFFFTLAVIVCVFPRQSKFKYEFTKGKPWMYENINAQFDFLILKSVDEIKSEQDSIRSEHTPIFNYEDDIFKKKAKEYISQFDESWEKDRQVKNNSLFWKILKKNQRKDSIRKNNLKFFGLKKLEAFYAKGIIQIPGDFKDKNKLTILLRNGSLTQEVQIDKEKYYNIESAKNEINLLATSSDVDSSFLVFILLSSLEPNITYDKLKSETLLSNKLENITSTKGLVLTGEEIINKGELVTDERYQKLLSLKQEHEGKPWTLLAYYLVLLGQIILVALPLFILFLFIKQNRLEILNNTTKISMILSVILLMVVISSLVVALDVNYIYVIPFCIVPIIVKAFFDTYISIFTHLITILIIGFIITQEEPVHDFAFEFVFLQLIAGIVSILTVLKMYKRSQLFISVAKVIVVYFVIYVSSLIVANDGSLSESIFLVLGQLAISGILTLLAYPTIFLFEKIFSLISDVSLLELTDTNSVLLRQLSEKAPGTFQHSLQVANLAEMGALEVGANALLIRAGALYHDVGKLKNPRYFIENQSNNWNPHDEIEFDESAKIIINHVLNGIEIAQENNLPDELIDFIRTHHGTTTVQYFYKQFIINFPEEEVDIKAFTYPGPNLILRKWLSL